MTKGCFHYEGPILIFEPNFTDPRKPLIKSSSLSPSREYCNIIKQ
jgi:hypothetical protein